MKDVCTRCGGKGVIEVPDPSYLDGIRLERCGCRWTAVDFNLPDRYVDKELSNYKGHRKLLLDLKNYVEQYENGCKGIYFHGPNGTGKTHLSIALIKELGRKKGIRGKYISYVDLLMLKRESFNQQHLVESIREFEEAELLVLDDIGVEKESAWVMEQTTSLVDFRYRSCLTTIFTSNYSLENLKHRFGDIVVGYRIVSRIAEMCISISLEFEDYRLRTFKENKYE